MDTAKADADLDKIAAKVKALEDGRHVVKISAVFDDSSVSKARTAFAQLDNAISRDAMQRLRSSPQGSVLGALNALFSPHPVTGAPSAQQAASQGLLGKIFGPQGGGTTNMPGGTGSSSSTNTNVVRDVVTGQSTTQPGTATEQVKLVQQGAAPSPGTGTERSSSRPTPRTWTGSRRTRPARAAMTPARAGHRSSGPRSQAAASPPLSGASSAAAEAASRMPQARAAATAAMRSPRTSAPTCSRASGR